MENIDPKLFSTHGDHDPLRSAGFSPPGRFCAGVASCGLRSAFLVEVHGWRAERLDGWQVGLDLTFLRLLRN